MDSIKFHVSTIALFSNCRTIPRYAYEEREVKGLGVLCLLAEANSKSIVGSDAIGLTIRCPLLPETIEKIDQFQ